MHLISNPKYCPENNKRRNPINSPKYNKINNPRKIRFKDKRIILKENPRKGRCLKCGKIGRTNMHHQQYDESDPLKYTIELCTSCHMKIHNRKIQNNPT